MGEPISLSMRGGSLQPAASNSKNSNLKSSAKTNPAGGSSSHPTSTGRIRLSSLYTLSDYSSEGAPNFQLQSMVIQPDTASPSTIDGIDKATWVGEGLAVAGGIGLLVGRDDTLSHWVGTFMITSSASNVLWEWVDRRHHLAHDHRLPRLVLSLVTGMALSNLLVLGFGEFHSGGIEGDPGRNPTGGYGP